MSSTVEYNHIFSDDRPIERKDQDVLGRSGFVHGLVKAIQAWHGKDSLVIGLNGPWGSGKTSIKNLVVEEIEQTKNTEVVVIPFNPWQWAGQDRLAESFFRQIGTNLMKADPSRWKRLAKKWKLYAAYLSVGKDAGTGIKSLIPYLILFTLAANWVAAIPNWLSVAALCIVLVLSVSSKLAKALSSLFESKAANEEKSLLELKRDLSQELLKANKTFLVVVDDLDRLTVEESRLVFQLIKANADFPNMVYLLLFQRELLEQQLNGICIGEGREFLEKIVQVPFDVPKVEKHKVWKVLTDGLGRILENPAAMERVDAGRYQTISIGYLRDYFKDLRDVNRFLGSFSFHAGAFMNEGVFEVNPVDLLAIEVLRMFEPDVYHALPDAKPFLTGSIARTSMFGIEGDEGKQEMKVIVECAPKERRGQIESLIKELFPPAARFFEGGTRYGGSFYEQWYSDLRVCHEYCFDRYFQLQILEGEISEREMKTVLAKADNQESFLECMKEYNAKGKLPTLLDRLNNQRPRVPENATVPFIVALFDISDALPAEEGGLLHIDANRSIISISFKQLHRINDPKRRAETFRVVLQQTTGVVAPISCLSIEAAKAGKKDLQEQDTVENEVVLEELKQIVIGKIKSKAENGSLVNLKELRSALRAWISWGVADDARQWIRSFVSSSDGLKRFLVAFVSANRAYSSGPPKITQWMSLEDMAKFIVPEEMEKLVRTLPLDSLSENEALAIALFGKAMERKREGKPDDDWERDSYR